jgi:negative regulator of sigma E activity
MAGLNFGGQVTPILSDWQNFLVSQLKNAFPQHTETDFHKIYRIYDLDAVGEKNHQHRGILSFI